MIYLDSQSEKKPVPICNTRENQREFNSLNFGYKADAKNYFGLTLEI